MYCRQHIVNYIYSRWLFSERFGLIHEEIFVYDKKLKMIFPKVKLEEQMLQMDDMCIYPYWIEIMCIDIYAKDNDVYIK